MKLKIPKELKDQIKESIIQSTSHGIPRIVASDNMLLRIVWILFTIISTGFCAYLIADNIISFYKYEVATKVRQKFELKPKFPSVTICNVNFFTTEYSVDYMNDTFRKKDDSIDISDNTEFIIQKSLTLSSNEIKKLGDSLNKLIIDGSIELVVMSISDQVFNYFFHPWYGNCYTYNPFRNGDGTIRNPKTILKVGYINSFYLKLNTSIAEEIPIPIRSQGAIIFIHEFGSSPFSVDSLTVAPGFETNIALQRTLTTMTPKPYSECDKDTDNRDKYQSDLYKSIHDMSFNYSQKACFDLCFHREMIKNCSCYFYLLTPFTEGKACLKQEEIDCTSDLYFDLMGKNYIDNICKPLCPLECYSVKYSKSISFSRLNQDSKDIAEINIYFEDFSYTEIEENQIMTEVGLVSNIGGIAGLFLGVSFLTFVEIVAICLDVFYYYMKQRKISKRQQSKKIEPEITLNP
ncbi:unnamed protein product [Brachionus calyciflorus]|uniref:Uncharacterized protein n=1 Tax=Brachionus calyciflorus TaxID=104777 RepID=A0A814IIC5_9BILA|nr:unnamed protein product [Brachionus calyciflorus]